MQNIIKLASIGVLGLFAVALIYQHAQTVDASIQEGNGYYATTSATPLGTQPANGFSGTTQVIKPGAGMLGPVIISSTTIGRISFFDATTSNATARAITATDTIAVMAPSLAAGTYTFDADFSVGLIVQTSADFNGAYTITYH